MSFRNLFEEYHDKVQFLDIYIREAHPIDGWWFGRRLTKTLVKKFSPNVSMDYHDPQTIEERRAVANDCETALHYGIRTYVDEMDDRVNLAYAAWPTRSYMVGMDGRIQYAAKMGPTSLKPKELKIAMDNYLDQMSRQAVSK